VGPSSRSVLGHADYLRRQRAARRPQITQRSSLRQNPSEIAFGAGVAPTRPLRRRPAGAEKTTEQPFKTPVAYTRATIAARRLKNSSSNIRGSW